VILAKEIYLTISCDVDPDFNFPFSRVLKGEEEGLMWRGVGLGISRFRRALSKSPFSAKYGQLCITWLLRADRQIVEWFGNPSFTFRQFEQLWDKELNIGGEIGWHPHLYRWHSSGKCWIPWLGQDDDVEMLAQCFSSLREHVDIKAVRTGWDYQSNRLMHLFDDLGMQVDGSAIPGSVEKGTSFHNWENTPRYPYHPSAADYRRPSVASEPALSIIEIPVLVEKLSFPLHLARYCLRNFRGVKMCKLTNYESARWRGIIITRDPNSFNRAVNQAMELITQRNNYFIATFFHPSELLSTKMLKNFICNLESLSRVVEAARHNLVPTTLGKAALLAKEGMLN
jgi:hypothetical protein